MKNLGRIVKVWGKTLRVYKIDELEEGTRKYIRPIGVIGLGVTVDFSVSELVKLAGYGAETIDYAVPQSFFDRNGPGYVWHYPKEGQHRLGGKPLEIGHLRELAMANIAIAWATAKECK